MRSMGWMAGIALAWALTACGGGGGGSTPTPTPPPPPATTLSGSIAPGPVAGATVQLFSVDAQGRTTLLEQVRTGNDGEYAFHATPAADTVLMVSANGGNWTDPLRKASATLDAPMRSLDVWAGTTRRVNITPYTEAFVRGIEKAKAPNWSAAGVRAASNEAARTLGFDSLTDFTRLDLTQPPGTTAPKLSDVSHAVANGSFLGFWHRLETTPGQLNLAAALDALERFINVDPEDDRLVPAFIAGAVDFVDVAALSADDKLAAKGQILYGTDIVPTPATIAQAMPRGVSSGGGQAPMPDDQFRLVGQPQGRTHFNLRGALVSYGEGDAKTRRSELYSASVAEVFADGDVGVGRWNGGLQQLTSPSGSSSVTNSVILSTDGWTYAAGRETSQVPACGLRKLSLAGSTKLLFTPWNSGDTGPALTLDADSALGALYLGYVQVGVDIGIRTAAGDTLRLQSVGGLDHPELAGLQSAAENEVFLNVPTSATFPAGSTATLTVRPAGAGARKAAALLKIRMAGGSTYSAALAFVAPDTPPDARGCAQPGAPGAGINPRPAPGSYYVFLNQADTDLFMGAPQDAVAFGSAGDLTGSLWGMKFAGPAFDLAGNAYASIGRITVTTGSAAAGNELTRSQPYAVAQPGAVTPTSGSAVYQLVAATAVTAERGSGQAQLPPGQIDAASVTVYFNQDPVGTINPNYGTARFNIAGRFAGLPFGSDVLASQGFGPVDVRIYGQTLGGSSQVSGSFAGPSGDYLVVLYRDGVSGVPVRAALLFKRQGS
ncbi:hypothetical protein J2X20_001157 [Pelomonas saccharophila]|uniref:Carboxypeptidase regulatory-like domain-containing protein n=1 Tax=Roseateles saccharophilus TaxID=304 RepID=A0ABU1YII4_ROSSA|nr:hypothetical protein [Roseateles saccharophilus]MDR7268528.1 hypothetical protein [Roseateles saccharophilus]